MHQLHDTSRGELSDTYTTSPHTGVTYYHLSSSYWADGLVNALSSNFSALPTLTYTLRMEKAAY